MQIFNLTVPLLIESLNVFFLKLLVIRADELHPNSLLSAYYTVLANQSQWRKATAANQNQGKC